VFLQTIVLPLTLALLFLADAVYMERGIEYGIKHSASHNVAATLTPTPLPDYIGEHIAIPAYFFDNTSAYSAVISERPVVKVVVVNHGSGPGSTYSEVFAAALGRLHEANIDVFGYVLTNWTHRSTADVESDIRHWFAWYHVGGIFLDQAPQDCASVSYYAKLDAFVRSIDEHALVALNPAMLTSECYMTVADIVVAFEGSYTSYLSHYVAPAWEKKYADSRFWHLIFGAGTTAEMTRIVALSQTRHAGYVYVTPDSLPNPWDSLPNAQYWSLEVKSVRR
jgi:hypothetical protein